MFNSGKVKSWLGKRELAKVELIDEDSEVIEVLLKEGFINKSDAETAWIMGKDRYESGDMTLGQIKDDLKMWMSQVGSE